MFKEGEIVKVEDRTEGTRYGIYRYSSDSPWCRVDYVLPGGHVMCGFAMVGHVKSTTVLEKKMYDLHMTRL